MADSTGPSMTSEARAAAEAERDAFFARKRDKRFNISPEESRKSAENYSTNRLTIPAGAQILNHMVEYRLDATFHALADPTRRGMLAHLAQGEKSIGDLAQPFAMSFAGASKHLKVLEGAGLVARRKVGRSYMCALKPAPLAEAEQWLKQWEKFWTVRLDALEAIIAADQKATRS
ncbi:metalloregulator ArsR/SmtB family transcription factor [Sphingomonas sp. NIBR02145]|uniref:ArsR/SmtB family transcription factor n=2 Tax=unclassified Sphingomonas TaxID=196159 RepID=UPI0022B4DF1D|nr:metalloregulator ArsR/SmtB family transcription factor [Sphingomonas sp. NIBR02145]WHU01809.1 metalloregulator ArsR/SmtB family transcription factor [Sphingomonas sp. NIBR02145]